MISTSKILDISGDRWTVVTNDDNFLSSTEDQKTEERVQKITRFFKLWVIKEFLTWRASGKPNVSLMLAIDMYPPR